MSGKIEDVEPASNIFSFGGEPEARNRSLELHKAPTSQAQSITTVPPKALHIISSGVTLNLRPAACRLDRFGE